MTTKPKQKVKNRAKEEVLVQNNGNIEVPGPVIEEIGTDFTFKHQIVWKNVILYSVFHVFGLYGLFLYFTFQVRAPTWIYMCVCSRIMSLGVTMGAHRYFTHRSFKAKPILRKVLMTLFIVSGQNTLWEWVRDHRQHHKYSDTDADPHNASRGFFFSHMGWLLSRKHPKVIEYGKKIDMSDLEADPWVMFQKKYFVPLYLVVAIIIPSMIPYLLWNEDLSICFLLCYAGRALYVLHVTWSVNSLAHIYGTRPYNKNILPVQSHFVSLMSLGEGWHNYHHAFPYDYRTSEYGARYNITGMAIDFLAKFGLAYDLKVPTDESIKNRVTKTGDNSHEKYGDVAKSPEVKTWMNVLKNPMNPTYSSIDKPVIPKIKMEYPLYQTN